MAGQSFGRLVTKPAPSPTGAFCCQVWEQTGLVGPALGCLKVSGGSDTIAARLSAGECLYALMRRHECTMLAATRFWGFLQFLEASLCSFWWLGDPFLCC